MKLFLAAFLLFPSFSGEEDSFGVEDLLSFHRLGDPQVSPDKNWVAYTQSTPNLEANTMTTQIWVARLNPREKPRQFTSHAKGGRRPRWSPDGKSIAYLSSRSGSSQIWMQDIAGGEPHQITDIPSGAGMHTWSPTGNRIAFASTVHPEGMSDEEREQKFGKALLTDHLMYRHWASWRDGKRSHLFLIEKKANGEWSIPEDLTPGHQEVPPISLGGAEEFCFSPDGRELAYSRGADPDVETWSTNADVWLMDLENRTTRNLTETNKGWDGSPSFSPDGKRLVYISKERDGFESDLRRVFAIDRATGKAERHFIDLKDHVRQVIWIAPSEFVVQVQQQGRYALHRETQSGSSYCITDRWTSARNVKTYVPIRFQESGNYEFVGLSTTLSQPAQLFWFNIDHDGGKSSLISDPNGGLFDRFGEMPGYQSITYEGAQGDPVQAWILKPHGFDPEKKYPLIYFIHGGPQGAWTNNFHYRWNPALFAAQGYVVMAPNPRGSTGFGQDFMEQISGDWGGKVYEDLMKGVDWIVSQGYIDEKRMGAMGGSYGGYMVNWILGHTDRFAACVSHAGLFNLESFYGATEELWFPEWDLGGPPWEDRNGSYQKWSPHRFAKNFKTPTLVIHGQLDFRVPVTEGFQLFTALQRQGVPSRLLYYPDEGHWINQPRNARLWNETVLDWMNRYVRDGGKSGQ